MKNNDFTPDRYMKELYGRKYNNPYADVHNAEQAAAVGEKIRASLAEAFGIDRIPGKTEQLQPRLLLSIKENGITRKKFSAEICDDLNMCFYLLVPEKKAPGNPGVTALCGHSYGARQIVRTRASGKTKILPFFDNYQKDFAYELARRGATVAVPELIGFGEARLQKDMHLPFYASSCKTLSSHLLLYGLTTASMRIYQAMRCTDILAAYGANPDNTGIMGISGGGLCALYTALLDKRIKKTVVSGYINTFETSILNRWHCPDNYIPGLLTIGEMYDFASALAPRSLVMECGEHDKLFPVEGSRRAIDKISRIYALYGSQDCFTADIFNGKHEVSGKLSYEFLTGERII